MHQIEGIVFSKFGYIERAILQIKKLIEHQAKLPDKSQASVEETDAKPRSNHYKRNTISSMNRQISKDSIGLKQSRSKIVSGVSQQLLSKRIIGSEIVKEGSMFTTPRTTLQADRLRTVRSPSNDEFLKRSTPSEAKTKSGKLALRRKYSELGKAEKPKKLTAE